jgi:hypothetical protein
MSNNPFRDQEKFMIACDQTVGVENKEQYSLYINLIEEEVQELRGPTRRVPTGEGLQRSRAPLRILPCRYGCS